MDSLIPYNPFKDRGTIYLKRKYDKYVEIQGKTV